MYKIHLLPALFGDSILIEYGKKEKPCYILIDGGPYYGFKDMMAALKKVAPGMKELELLVITHVDIDHIDGIITLLNQPKLPFTIKDIWFNGYEQLKPLKSGLLGALQGEYISLLLKKNKLPHNKHKTFGGKAIMVKDYNKLPLIKLPGGMEIMLLSPGQGALLDLKVKWEEEIAEINKKSTVEDRWKKEHRYPQLAPGLLGFNIKKLQEAEVAGDKSIANKSSIAFIGTYNGKSCLFAGDATSDFLLKAIDPMLKKSGKPRLSLDAWKLAHHGSKKSNLVSLMQKIDTKNMLISSDGSRYHHPDPECIAKLIGANNGGLNFYFNYDSKDNKGWKDANLQKNNKYSTNYPKDKNGITIVLS
jgi:beta-lactamase superfamily II metal-dependent hydrolase